MTQFLGNTYSSCRSSKHYVMNTSNVLAKVKNNTHVMLMLGLH